MPTWLLVSCCCLVILAGGCESTMIAQRCNPLAFDHYAGRDFCGSRERAWWL